MNTPKFAIIPLFLLLIALPLSAHAGQVIGKVTALKGTAHLYRTTHAKPILMTIGASIFVNDRIKTLADSWLRIGLEDGSMISMGEKAELHLEEFEFNPNEKKRTAFFNIAIGKFQVLVNDLSKLKKNDFKVRTPTALVGVRGTLFVVWVQLDPATRKPITTVACIENAVEVVNLFDQSQSVILPETYSIVIMEGERLPIPGPLTVERFNEIVDGLPPLEEPREYDPGDPNLKSPVPEEDAPARDMNPASSV